MNKNIGNISFFDSKQTDYNFTKPYSDSTAEKIDFEVKKIVEDAYIRTKNLLIDKKKELEKIANKLLEKEILFQNDIEKLIGKRPFKNLTTYQSYTEEKKPSKIEKKIKKDNEENNPKPSEE